jgi:hypothetical protein
LSGGNIIKRVDLGQQEKDKYEEGEVGGRKIER